MDDVYKLVRIQIGVIATFIINKFILRPFVLENDFPELFNIFVLSYSNFCEAMVGTITITCIGLVLNQRWKSRFKFKETNIYLMATILATIYVITQEFKIHNLGGNNVYDPYDVLFSLIGLVAAYVLLMTLKPKVAENSTVRRSDNSEAF